MFLAKIVLVAMVTLIIESMGIIFSLIYFVQATKLKRFT